MAQGIKKQLNNLDLSHQPSFFSPKIRLNKIRNLSSFNQFNNEDGFTLVELIVVVMMIGILSSIAIPQFMTAADKAKQKEATGIVAALVKAATAYNTEYGALPENAEELSEYAKFQKCTAAGVEDEGGKVCKGETPQQLDDEDTEFYASSGHYYIQFRRQADSNGDLEFQVLANPNGGAYASNGSAVTGCYNPTLAVSEVFEYTAKTNDKGDGKDFRSCEQN
tara:strand:+ start:359 stop:1024 length:666 start_codon:yes stop_codon:yes gene_type:complete